MAEQWTVTKWSGLDNYECAAGDCPFATLDQDRMVRHQIVGHGGRARTVARKMGALAGVDFASDETAEYAATLVATGLTSEHFDFEKSGKTGYTKKDVERAARDLTTTHEEHDHE